MPSHSQQLRLELGRPLFLLPSSGFHSPGAWCPHLCTRQASFSAHERDLERRGIHGACLVGAPPALLLGGNSSRAVRVSPGLQEAQPPCNKRYMWQTRKEKKRDDTSSHSSSLPQRADPLVVQAHWWCRPTGGLFSAPEQRRPRLARGPLCTQLPTHFFLRILGFFTGRR